MLFRRFGIPALAAAMLFSAVTVSAQIKPPQDEKSDTYPCGPRVWIEYTDDDPDYFIIKNRSANGWSLVMLAIDLAPSTGNLVFDTEAGGPGVGGAAAFYPGDSAVVRLIGTVPAQDGGKSIALSFEGFAPGHDYNFSVDLDALPSDGGRTWVLPQDIKNTRVLATFEGPSAQREKVDAIFDENAEADSGAGGCV